MAEPVKQVTQDLVLEHRDALPAFPRVIEEILMSLDDPDANMTLLVRHVERDPVVSARVFSLANAAANRTRRDAKVRDIYTATSLIGMTRLRQAVIMTSLSGFLRGALPPGLSPGFWEHSTATGVSAQQLASHARLPADAALIAGLLHDIGQLWLYRFEPETFMSVWKQAGEHTMLIDEAERAAFGVDHAQIGAWLAESWGLPPAIVAAILLHHAPDAGLQERLVAVVHVAEVLSNALDLGNSSHACVTDLSAKACAALDLRWDESAENLFGRIEGVSRFVATYFR